MSFGASTSSGTSDLTSLLSSLFNTTSSTTGANNSTTNTGTTGTTGSTYAQTLTPAQQAAQAQLSKTISAISTNPQAFVAPAASAAREGINQNYSGVADTLRQQFMGGSSGGASGKYGGASLTSDLARRGQIASSDTSFANTAAMLPITGAGLAQNLLATNLGGTTAGTSATTGTGTTSGTTTSGTVSSGSSSQTGSQTGTTTGTKAGGGFAVPGLG